MDASISATIFSVRCLPSSPNVRSTYSLPSDSPSCRSTITTHRLQRGASSLTPDNVASLNWKSSATNAFGSIPAASFTTCQVRYVFTSAADAAASTELMPVRNPGVALLNESMPNFTLFRYASHANPEAVCPSCTSVTVLYLFCGSRNVTRSAETLASAVSISITAFASAAARAASWPSSPNIFCTCATYFAFSSSDFASVFR